MARFNKIQRVMTRINNIKSKFKKFKNPKVGHTPFDANLKIAMGNRNGMMPVGLNTPNSLQALLNKAGATNLATGGLKGDMGQKLAEFAKKWDGKEFKPGQRERCADFVSTMIKKSGIAPSNFKHEVNCWELQKQGRKVEKKNLKPGDVVYFGYTYLPTDYTHVGIYIGDGKFVHRPTSAKPVVVDSLDKGYYARKFCGARRLNG